MYILQLLQEIKKEYQNANPFLMPVEKKDVFKEQLLLQLHKEKQNKRLNYIDNDHNNLLHLIFQIPMPDIDCVRFLLENSPNLANEQNKFDQRPCDILWQTENNSHISNRPLKALLCEYMEDGFAKEALQQECNISILERFSNIENDSPSHCRTLRFSEISNIFNRPTLLCFPGRYAFNSKEANGLGKFMRKMLHINEIDTPEIQTLSAWYPGNTLDLGSDLYAFMSPYIKYDNDSPFEYVRRFVHRTFRPLYIDEDGYRLPTMKAAKNMRMVNLFGYSYGAAVIQMIANELSEDMKNFGYSTKESALIQSQIFVLTIGYYGNSNNYKNNFSCYHLLHAEDKAACDTLTAAIDKKDFNNQGFYISRLKQQENQKVYMLKGLNLDCTQDPHNIKNYFETTQNDAEHALMTTWKDCLLINALNNSLQNSKSDDFKMLPARMDFLPSQIDFLPTMKEQEILKQIQRQAIDCAYQKQQRNLVSKHKRVFLKTEEEKTRES